MLDNVASYHCTHFQGKLINQMAKNLNLGLILAHLAQIWVAKILFSKIWLRQSLDIMVSYHNVQYQKKLMIQSWENLVTDGQTDESDFIRRCPTNAERLKNKTNERSFDFLKLLRWLLRHFLLTIFSMDSWKYLSSQFTKFRRDEKVQKWWS